MFLIEALECGFLLYRSSIEEQNIDEVEMIVMQRSELTYAIWRIQVVNKTKLNYSNQTQENEQVCFSSTKSGATTVAVIGAP